MKSNIMIAILILSSSLVTGCSEITTQLKPMEEPIGGSRSRLRVISDTFVKAVPERDCIDWSSHGAGTVFGGMAGSNGFRGRSLGMPNPPSTDLSTIAELYITADKPITLFYNYGGGVQGGYHCSFAVSFKPNIGKDYEAKFQFDEKSRQCFVIVRTLGQIQETVQVTSAQQCK